eukprot:GHVT01011815.1.p1 GENE.GHVT01011815.1~~GHVT01011815.1.p1  ORF type:complete len:217 (-),score=19.49 GHVT01011815.1:1321-1971(-)
MPRDRELGGADNVENLHIERPAGILVVKNFNQTKSCSQTTGADAVAPGKINLQQLEDAQMCCGGRSGIVERSGLIRLAVRCNVEKEKWVGEETKGGCDAFGGAYHLAKTFCSRHAREEGTCCMQAESVLDRMALCISHLALQIVLGRVIVFFLVWQRWRGGPRLRCCRAAARLPAIVAAPMATATCRLSSASWRHGQRVCGKKRLSPFGCTYTEMR